MYFPSITTIIGVGFLIYVLHSTWTLTQLFTVIKCSGTPCFTSYLSTNPKLQLVLFTSTSITPKTLSEVNKVITVKNFDYENEFQRDIEIDIPAKTRRNGTLYLHIVVAQNNRNLDWDNLQLGDGPTVIKRIPLTEYAESRATPYNLLGEKSNDDNKLSKDSERKSESAKPVTFIKSKVFIIMLTDPITMSYDDVPGEIAALIRINRKNEFLPILHTDFFKTKLKHLVEVTKNMRKTNLSFNYNPIGIGKFRLMMQMEHATKLVSKLGFSHKDIDEIKEILSETNYYLLIGTFCIGSVHLLFDFLSFKNDIEFWQRKQNFAGLSVRTTLWRAFSQIVVLLYLLDEETSLLVLIPAGISALIELWKCKKILKIHISLFSGFKIKNNENNKISKDEKQTEEFDKEAMKYLSYLLYPLCIAGAVYSLIYQPHKSWYSWTINSLVNGVYAFGFLFMLPQLFVNYKLKSVAALPWRAFMYKAFNTFIDDIFAFILVMPTAHRVACFRDDVVFIIYLYQRWLYPVDKNRIDYSTSFAEDETQEVIKNVNENEVNSKIDDISNEPKKIK